ncbi:MAG: spore germination protein [Clostridiales bacterium]|jgi:spore germination protein KA|nr:spore germination protein [Clostridiales bacterium]
MDKLGAREFESLLKEKIGGSFDVIINRFATAKREAVVAYVSGMADKNLIDRDVITPLKSKNFDGDVPACIGAAYETAEDETAAVRSVLEGDVVLYYDLSGVIYTADLRKFSTRAVTLPDSESVIRGPKEAFNESIATNVSLVRRKLKSPDLVFEQLKLGRQTQTTVVVAYLNGTADKKVLRNLRQKLNRIEVEGVLESGQIEQFIEREPYALLPNAGLTQKPDIVAAKLLEGRIAVFCDGTPHVLTVPELFAESFSTAEDYYSRTLISNTLRFLRFFAFYLSIFLPGTMIAVLNFHQEMIPYVFLKTFIGATSKRPLPEFIEVLMLTVMFELIKEGGTRLPKTAGAAITIVGALIIGDAAVNAGIVGAPSVILVALTAVASLLVNSLNEFIVLFRIIMMVLGATMGLIGIASGTMILLTYIVSKESFGVNILTEYSKHRKKDSLWRRSLPSLKFKKYNDLKDAE